MDYLPFVELDNNYVRGKKKSVKLSASYIDRNQE